MWLTLFFSYIDFNFLDSNFGHKTTDTPYDKGIWTELHNPNPWNTGIIVSITSPSAKFLAVTLWAWTIELRLSFVSKTAFDLPLVPPVCIITAPAFSL